MWHTVSKLYCSYQRGFLMISSAHDSKVYRNIHSWIFGAERLIETCKLNDHGYVPLVVNTSRSFPNSSLMTGFVTRFLVSVIKCFVFQLDFQLKSGICGSAYRQHLWAELIIKNPLIWQAWSLVFLPTKFAFLLKIIFFIRLKSTKITSKIQISRSR
jgi:hypothetical protein